MSFGSFHPSRIDPKETTHSDIENIANILFLTLQTEVS